MLCLVDCSTQKDLNRIIAAGDIAILRTGYFEIWGNATVEAWGNATVRAWGNATVRASDSATVRASGNATVEASGNATVEAWDSATVRASVSATVRASGNATVRAWGNATVRASGNATVEAWDSATVRAWGNATVEASVNATVEAWDSASVVASDSASVRAIARAVVRVLASTVKVHASGWATVILHAAAQITTEASVAVIDRVIHTAQDWGHAFGAQERDGKLVLLKWVRQDGASSHGFAYPQGQTVEAPDWDPREDLECGCGLHACATLSDAEHYEESEGRLAVELLVDPSECRAPQPTDSMPDKIRFRRAFVARVWDPMKEDA